MVTLRSRCPHEDRAEVAELDVEMVAPADRSRVLRLVVRCCGPCGRAPWASLAGALEAFDEDYPDMARLGPNLRVVTNG